MTLTPEERVMRARLAAHTKWANVDDRKAATESGRKTFMDRFEKQVDPDGVLSLVERARRAEHAKSAYFAGLAFKSSKARRARK